MPLWCSGVCCRRMCDWLIVAWRWKVIESIEVFIDLDLDLQCREV